MKIVLAALNAKYVHSNLAVYDLQAYAEEQWNKQDGVKPQIVIREYTINHNLDLILQSLYQEKAAVIAFSCYIWNISEILCIAKELKKVAPHTHIWLGGPEVSYDSVKLLEGNPYIEGVIQGEGEATFYEMTCLWQKYYVGSKNEMYPAGQESCLQNTISQEDKMTQKHGQHDKDYKQALTDIQGIVYRDVNGGICENNKRPLICLDDVPFITRI